MKFEIEFELEVLSWCLNLKFEVKVGVWSWSLKLKFEVEIEVWSWSLNLKFEVEVWTWRLESKFENENRVKCIKWINKRMELNEMNEAMNEINK